MVPGANSRDTQITALGMYSGQIQLAPPSKQGWFITAVLSSDLHRRNPGGHCFCLRGCPSCAVISETETSMISDIYTILTNARVPLQHVPLLNAAKYRCCQHAEGHFMFIENLT